MHQDLAHGDPVQPRTERALPTEIAQRLPCLGAGPARPIFCHEQLERAAPQSHVGARLDPEPVQDEGFCNQARRPVPVRERDSTASVSLFPAEEGAVSGQAMQATRRSKRKWNLSKRSSRKTNS